MLFEELIELLRNAPYTYSVFLWIILPLAVTQALKEFFSAAEVFGGRRL
jgi:hypothetical protein